MVLSCYSSAIRVLAEFLDFNAAAFVLFRIVKFTDLCSHVWPMMLFVEISSLYKNLKISYKRRHVCLLSSRFVIREMVKLLILKDRPIYPATSVFITLFCHFIHLCATQVGQKISYFTSCQFIAPLFYVHRLQIMTLEHDNISVILISNFNSGENGEKCYWLIIQSVCRKVITPWKSSRVVPHERGNPG